MRFLSLLLPLFIACAGPEGPPGPPGPVGPPGAPGLPGESGSGLVTKVACSQQRVSIGSYIVNFEADRYEFADGSVMTTCEVYDASAGYFGTNMYKASQAGAQSGACFVTYDVDSSSLTGGFFQFTIPQGSTTGTATYIDAGSPSNGRAQTLACTRY